MEAAFFAAWNGWSVGGGGGGEVELEGGHELKYRKTRSETAPAGTAKRHRNHYSMRDRFTSTLLLLLSLARTPRPFLEKRPRCRAIRTAAASTSSRATRLTLLATRCTRAFRMANRPLAPCR